MDDSNKFQCLMCNYSTSNKSNYNKHFKTKKHLNNMEQEIKIHSCENCHECFNNRTSLWRHKKKCISQTDDKEDIKDLYKVIETMAKQQQETNKIVYISV